MSKTQDTYLSYLHQCIPVNTLVRDALKIFNDTVTFKSYKSNQNIFSIGDEDTFQLYLIEGEIELSSKDNKRSVLHAKTKQSLYPISFLKPRMYSAKSITDETIIASIESDLLDKLLIWEQSVDENLDTLEVSEIFIDDSGENQDWKMSMLRTPIFLRLPAAKIMSLFESMQHYPVSAGQKIITQGEQGDYYYIIKSGRCKVSRNFDDDPDSKNIIQLNELSPTDSFGEEALVSGEPRNATITMLTDGELMRLAKDDFRKMLEEPLLNWIDFHQAHQLMEKGALPIDVRMEEEFNNSGIQNTTNIPLYLLRLSMDNLNKAKTYLLLCDSGARSSAAAFLMSQHGFQHTYILQGGIQALLQINNDS